MDNQEKLATLGTQEKTNKTKNSTQKTKIDEHHGPQKLGVNPGALEG